MRASRYKIIVFISSVLMVILIIGTNVYTFIVFDRASVLEAFMLACGVLGLTMWVQRIETVQGLVRVHATRPVDYRGFRRIRETSGHE